MSSRRLSEIFLLHIKGVKFPVLPSRTKQVKNLTSKQVSGFSNFSWKVTQEWWSICFAGTFYNFIFFQFRRTTLSLFTTSVYHAYIMFHVYNNHQWQPKSYWAKHSKQWEKLNNKFFEFLTCKEKRRFKPSCLVLQKMLSSVGTYIHYLVSKASTTLIMTMYIKTIVLW